uniref:Uncharacterized protein LOC104240911 isoform X1 n=1 Tax=Nicotiana sylvestris TaxID=4096 RepID=A0A1U7XPW2_NICSY|nr:PREDICTED: uncharacterized protein LOC104240911 isoform X1 [Nicotiana sylvestris]
MVSVRGESSQRITQISSHKTRSVANELASGSIEVKNVEDLGDRNHPGNYWVVATIVHVELDRGWCYLACKNCSKKLEKAGNKFYCKKCEQIQSVIHRYDYNLYFLYYYMILKIQTLSRYRLQVKVMDCTDTISLLLWDKDGTKIIEKSANDLKDVEFETSGAADDSSCPMEIENIVEKRVMFKVEVNSSNNQNKDVVLRVIRLTDDEEIIKKYIPSPQEETFKDSTEDNELIDVAHTPAKIGLTNPVAVVEEDSNARLSENKIKRVFKKEEDSIRCLHMYEL